MRLQADVHLVVDVQEHAYLAIDKGPISETHALVVSVEHYPNTVTLPAEARADMDSIIGNLTKMYAAKGLQLVGFERLAPLPHLCCCVPSASMLVLPCRRAVHPSLLLRTLPENT